MDAWPFDLLPLVMDQLREWQGEGGPTEWQAAWGRTLQLVGPQWVDERTQGLGTLLLDGGAALTTALYLVAREQSIPVADVHRPAVAELVERRHGRELDIPTRWESRLQGLGHDLDSSDDPVSRRWRLLRIVHDPPEHDGAEDSTARCGPGVVEGMRSVLSMDLRF